ncbi:hypothetical protein D9M68_449280 [compost metagenome]
MDYFIIVITTAAGLYFHWWLYVRIKRWMDRDLALSLAEGDKAKQAFMLEQLEQARKEGIKRKQLPDRLRQAADDYRAQS